MEQIHWKYIFDSKDINLFSTKIIQVLKLYKFKLQKYTFISCMPGLQVGVICFFLQ